MARVHKSSRAAHQRRPLAWQEWLAVISEGVGMLMTLYLLSGLPFPPRGTELGAFIALLAVLLCDAGLLVTLLRRSVWAAAFGLALGLYCFGFLMLRGRQLLVGLAPIVTGGLDGDAVALAYSSLLVMILLAGHGIASALAVGRHLGSRAVAA